MPLPSLHHPPTCTGHPQPPTDASPVSPPSTHLSEHLRERHHGHGAAVDHVPQDPPGPHGRKLVHITHEDQRRRAGQCAQHRMHQVHVDLFPRGTPAQLQPSVYARCARETAERCCEPMRCSPDHCVRSQTSEGVVERPWLHADFCPCGGGDVDRETSISSYQRWGGACGIWLVCASQSGGIPGTWGRLRVLAQLGAQRGISCGGVTLPQAPSLPADAP